MKKLKTVLFLMLIALGSITYAHADVCLDIKNEISALIAEGNYNDALKLSVAFKNLGC